MRYNHNRMSQSELASNKYWVTQSDYFRLATAVALSVDITYGGLLFYHGISDKINGKTISDEILQ